MTKSSKPIYGLDSHIPEPALDFQQLPPFLRVLLTTDGTVTKSLEAFFWEPVNVEAVVQGERELTAGDLDLVLPPGARILHRQVRLRGERSNRIYASASSLVCVSRLPDPVRAGLQAGQMGIGELLRESGLDTYRKILRFGACNEPVAERGDLAESVWREYLILRDARPLIKIRETFPLRLFE